MFLPLVGDNLAHFHNKEVFIKAAGLLSKKWRVEGCLFGFLDGLNKAIYCLFMEQHATDAILHDIERAALAISDDRCAGS